MANDSLIQMVQCLQNLETVLKINTREQYSRIDLVSIRAYCDTCLAHCRQLYTSDYALLVSYLNNMSLVCDNNINDPKFKETDMEEKEFIVQNYKKALVDICLKAGKFYTSDNQFEFRPTLVRVYNFIIDTCIDNKYYFGVEKFI